MRRMPPRWRPGTRRKARPRTPLRGASGVSDYEDQGDRDFGEDPASEIVSEDDAAAGTVDSGTGDADGPSSLIEDTDGGEGQDIPAGDTPDLFYEDSAGEANADMAGEERDTGLKIRAYDGTRGQYTVNPGEDITFHAIATVDPSVEDQTITYTWEEVSTYDEVGTGETYTIHDVQKGYYLICKAEDAYGNSEYMYFSVGIKNDWTVELYSGDEFLTSTWSSNGNKTVPYNGSLTLTAKVRDASPETNLSYCWKPGPGYDQLQGESHEAEMTLNNITEAQEWECDVTDQYDNIERVYCLVKPDTGLKLSTDQGTYSEGYYEIETSSDSYTLRVKVSAAEEFAGKPFSYAWTSSKVNEYVRDEGEGTIASADEEITLHIDDVKHGYANYTCVVTDAAGTQDSVNFRFLPGEELAVADRSLVRVLNGSTGSYVDLDAAADAGIGDTSQYGYQWQYYDEFGSRVLPINSEKYKKPVFSYKIPYDHNLDVYLCTIADGYSRTADLTYYLLRDGDLQTLSYEEGEAPDEISLEGKEPWNLFKVRVDEAGEYCIYTGLSDALFNVFDQTGDELISGYGYDNSVDTELLPDTTYYVAVRNSEKETFRAGIEKVPDEPEYDHDMEWWIDEEPTCEEEGYEHQECIDCGERGDERIIPALGHDWDDGEVTVPATCAAEGVMTCTCERCGRTKTEAIPKTGVHSFGAWKTTAEPSALKEGAESRTCSVCGKTEERKIARLAASGYLNAKTVPLKKKQKSHAVTVEGMAEGDYVRSCISSNTKVVKASPYGTASVSLKAGKKTGKATVTVTLASGKQLKLTVKVRSGKVKAKKISITCGRKLTLKKGESIRIGASVTPITTTDKVKYSSSSRKVTKVTKDGVITAKKKGKAVITVRAGNKTVKIKVTVK